MVAERAVVGKAMAVAKENHVAHLLRSSHNLCIVAVTDIEYPAMVARSLVGKINSEFGQQYSSWAVDDATTKDQLEFEPLKDYIDKYQDPNQADTIMKVQKELDDTKVVMHQTIESLLQRGENLSSLVDKSSELSAQSKTFYKTAKKTNTCMDNASSNSGPPKRGHSNGDVAHAQSNQTVNKRGFGSSDGPGQGDRGEEECCRHCCKHRCCPKHTDDPASAEQLADDAAKDAGWNIRWPRIQMMADSPDLQRLREPANTQQQQQQQQQNQKQQQHQKQSRNNTRDDPARSAWTQVRKFATEITEVFRRQRSNTSAADATNITHHDENNNNNSNSSSSNTEDATALLEAAAAADIDKQYDDARIPTSEHPEPNEEEENRAATWRERAMVFARGYPLLVLLCGWLAMVALDWVVTSEAIPRLVSFLTARPWSPFSESFVLRAVLQQPGLLDNSVGDMLGIGQAVKTRLVSGELMLDDLIWRTQAFAAASLVPLAQSHALLWLCVALLSFGAVRRCSKVGPRAALLCIAYFVAADYALWSILGPTPLDHIASGSLVMQPSYECNSGACTLTLAPPLRHPVPLSPNDGTSSHTYLQPRDVRSPFADAVQQAIQIRSALVERRTERLRRLHGWRQHVKQAFQDQHAHKSGGISVLATLATLSFYICLSRWASKYVSISTLQTFLLLFGMDALLHGVFASSLKCVVTHGGRFEDDVVQAVANIDTTMRAFFAGWLVCVRALVVHTPGFWSCALFQGAYSAFDSHTATSGRLLPIHVLSVTLLLALRECAYAVHSMRVWYSAVVRERRRGPAILTVRRAGSTRISVSRCDEPVAPVPISYSSVASVTRYAAYAHRICFMCLGGFCERCLLSMEIWPTADSSSGLGIVADIGQATSAAQKRLPPVTAAAAAAAAAAVALTPQHMRRRAKASSRHGRSVPSASTTSAALPSVPTTAAFTSSATDPLAIDAATNGLPPLYESLRTIADIVDQQPALSGTDSAADVVLTSLSGAVGRLGGLQGPTGARRGRTIDVWVASSVAHCPCRLVHGVGPSSFVAKPASGAKANTANMHSDGEKLPTGTLLALAQYARELKSLGLVRSVDPVSAVHADDDPAASVLPLIFGRFAVPENPQAVAAANALLQSSGGGGHTPGEVPFLRTGPTMRQGTGFASGGGASVLSQASDAAGTSTSAEPSSGNRTRRPSRILAKPTPLSTVRSLGSGTFRLCVDAVLASQGAANVSVVMTPVLAHLLLTHPRTAPTAAVCVPASLVSAIVSRARRNQASSSRSAKAAVPATADGNGSNIGAAAADVDPFIDHVRVQLLRSDVVVRVNGVRWPDFELDRDGSLNRPLSVRNLPPNHVHSICVSVCGMRSEELAVVVPAIDASTAFFGSDVAKGGTVLSGHLASRRVEDVATCMEQLDVLHKQQQTAQQKLRKIKREFPRQIQNLQNELESVRRVLSRHADSSARFEPQRAHLAASIDALAAETADLRAQLQEHSRDLDALTTADIPAIREETVSGATTTRALTGFSVLSTLDDHETLSSTHQSRRKSTADRGPVSLSDVDQALAAYQDIEARARRAQDKHEDSIQGLKADRAQWMAQLSQLTQRLNHLDNLIDPVRRDLKEVTRLAAVGTSMEAKLRRKLEDTAESNVVSKDSAAAGKKNKQRLVKNKKSGKKAAESDALALVSGPDELASKTDDIKSLTDSHDDLSKSLNTLRKALEAERIRTNELLSLSPFKK
ncbi:palmitoyltransferase [Coemansia sp. RSA 487]|nr:palmitoyltransferase [Coemansia sp. RSA 487]